MRPNQTSDHDYRGALGEGVDTDEGAYDYMVWHGLLMRDVTDLRIRIETLERSVFKASMRPQVQTAGTASVVAGTVFGVLELLRYTGVFK